MKNEEFRKMFTDYAEEISDPENRKVCFDECYKSNLLKHSSLKKTVVHMYNKRPPIENIFKILLDHGEMGTCHNLSYVIAELPGQIRSDIFKLNLLSVVTSLIMAFLLHQYTMLVTHIN